MSPKNLSETSDQSVGSLWWSFVRFAFRLLYNELAWTYDLVAWVVSLGQWKAWGRSAIPFLSGKRILELAHGPGHLLVAMEERGLTPVGLDLSPAMGRLARRRLRRHGLSLPLVRAQAQALPFPSASFDGAVATFPTEFIVDPATVDEIARVLGPRGRMVVVAFATLGRQDALSRFIEWLYRITGQRDVHPDTGRAAVAAAGFLPHTIWQRVGHSEVKLVVAEKKREPRRDPTPDDRTAGDSDSVGSGQIGKETRREAE